MIKLLQIPNYYYPHTGGIEQVCRDIVHSLSDKEIKQKVICFNGDANRGDQNCDMKETTVDIVDDIEIHRCGCITKIASQSISLTYPRELKKLIEEFDPDVIIFHYPNPYVASFFIPILKTKTKLILYWHLDIIKQRLLKIFFYNQTKKLLDRANVIIATSPNYIEGSKHLSQYKRKCVVVPNCVSIDFEGISDYAITKSIEIRNQYKDKCICFTVGRHIQYKGFDYLIESASYLDDNFIVLIGGNGPLTKRLKEKARGLNNVEFLGFINDEDLIAYYLACDIITFSSVTKNEAFGISLAEGMSFGKPAVTFSIPGSGVNYVNLKNETGFEVPNRDCKAYAKAIINLYTDKDKYDHFRTNAKKRVNQNFTFKIFKKNITEVIENTVFNEQN